MGVIYLPLNDNAYLSSNPLAGIEVFGSHDYFKVIMAANPSVVIPWRGLRSLGVSIAEEWLEKAETGSNPLAGIEVFGRPARAQRRCGGPGVVIPWRGLRSLGGEVTEVVAPSWWGM